MKFKKAISLFLAFILLFAGLVSCTDTDNLPSEDLASPENEQPDSVDKKIVFSTMSGSNSDIEISSAYADLTADKTVFPIDDVTLSCYYGFAWYTDFREHYALGQYYPYVDITFDYYACGDDNLPDESSYFPLPMNRVENIMTDEYRCTTKMHKNDDEGPLYFKEYNHSEKLTIPALLFEDTEDGFIFFTIYYQGYNIFDGTPIYLSASAGFYYIQEPDNTIKIYPSVEASKL